MKKNTLGKLLRENREKQNFTKTTVCRGLCTVMALSRYEKDERIPDKFLLDALLERLGLNPFRYEFVASDQEFYYSRKRENIERLLYEQKNREAWEELKAYENQIQGKDHLHMQYILMTRGMLLEKEEKYKEAAEMVRNALKYTKADHLEQEKQADLLLTNNEIALVFLLGKFQYLTGKKNEASVSFRMLKWYMEHRQMAQEKWKEYYAYLLYGLAQYELDFYNLGKSYEYVKQAEQILTENYLFGELYEVLKLKQTLCLKLGIQEEVDAQSLLMLRLISMGKNGKLTKEGLNLWENTANQQL